MDNLDPQEEQVSIPPQLPILPLRNTVAFPYMLAPLRIEEGPRRSS